MFIDNSYFLKQILGRSEDALIGKVRQAQPRLLPYKIARDGSLMEWVCPYLLYPPMNIVKILFFSMLNDVHVH